MTNQGIKDLIGACSGLQATLTGIQIFLQQYSESHNVLDIKFRIGRLEGIWNKYKEIQDTLESIDWDSSKHDDFRNYFEKKITS
jgi:hypothetical protein